MQKKLVRKLQKCFILGKIELAKAVFAKNRTFVNNTIFLQQLSFPFRELEGTFPIQNIEDATGKISAKIIF